MYEKIANIVFLMVIPLGIGLDSLFQYQKHHHQHSFYAGLVLIGLGFINLIVHRKKLFGR